MPIYNTHAHDAQRTPLVKLLELDDGVTTNPVAETRDTIRLLNPGISFTIERGVDDAMQLHIGPGEIVSRGLRKEVERAIRHIPNPNLPPSVVDIEFSSLPTELYPSSQSLPEDYNAFTLDWAIGLCHVAIIAETTEKPGHIEPFQRVRPIQTIIRCPAAAAQPWFDYLSRRLTRRQRLAHLRVEFTEAQR